MAGGQTHGSARDRHARGGQSGLTLIEILVVMIILSIVGTMIIMGWWAATQSMAYSSNSAEARDQARFGIDRLTREIRDAQLPDSDYLTNGGFPASTPAIVRARPTWIALFSSFNVPGSLPNPSVHPRLVMYVLYPDGDLWRYADLDGNGLNSDGNHWYDAVTTLTTSGPTDSLEETAKAWEGASLITGNVVNGQIADPNVAGSTSTDLFNYSVYGQSGSPQLEDIVLGDPARSGIIAVQIHLLVDLNPGHSPVHMDLETFAQLRNEH